MKITDKGRATLAHAALVDGTKITQASMIETLADCLSDADWQSWQLRKCSDLDTGQVRDAVI